MRALLVAAALLASGVARAGPEVALRLGVAAPSGDAVPGVPVADLVRMQFPVQLDALWRAGALSAGAYGSWGLGLVRCDPGASCDASVWRLGLQATWSFRRGEGASGLRAFEPWVGLATGYEWAVHGRSRGGSDVSTTFRGFELVALQGGLEWRIAPRVALGPAFLIGVGRYSHMSVATPVESASAPLADRSVHAWYHLAARARVTLGREPR
jgi:hypothetical protein